MRNKIAASFVLLFFACALAVAASIVYEVGTGRIIESGSADKARFDGDPRYAMAEVQSVPLELNKRIYNSSTGEIERKSMEEVDVIDNSVILKEILYLENMKTVLLMTQDRITDQEILDLIVSQIVLIDAQIENKRSEIRRQ